MSAIVLDTDVVSNVIKDRLDPRLAARLLGHDLAITFVTLGEPTRWVDFREWGVVRRRKLDDFLIGRAVLPGSKRVAETWGHVAALAARNGTPQPINDSWIAACCLTYRVPLATCNVKDFLYFRDEHGLKLIAV